MRTDQDEKDRSPFSASRLKSFTDAVVAIAMTLLILPLTDSIGDAAGKNLLAGAWLNAELPQLFSFVLSFLLIANFWVTHHRLFDGIDQVTTGLLWLTIAWMFTIVWLPVATAVVGQLADDPVQKLLYIGSMWATSLIMLATRVHVLRHPELHRIPAAKISEGTVTDVVLSIFFAVALVFAILVPAVGYWALLLLLLTRPAKRVLGKIRSGRRSPDA